MLGRIGSQSFKTLLAALILCTVSLQASSSTFIRANLEYLTDNHSTIVVGTVTDLKSYWTPNREAILTDVTINPSEIIKGYSPKELEITVLGGTVDDLTYMVIGGAELRIDHEYLLFIENSDLPDINILLPTIKEHAQGVFYITEKNGKKTATSQANELHLLSDHSGSSIPPGGNAGFDLNHLKKTIDQLSNGQSQFGGSE